MSLICKPIRNKPARYKIIFCHTCRLTFYRQSKLLVNRLVEKLHANSSPQRQLVRALLLPVESRNLIVTGLVQSLFVRSVVTRNQPSCWSASCPSSVLCEKSLRISRPICVSRAPLWWLFKKLVRLTLLVCLKTPTCAPSTPSALPSCPRTFSWPAESAESEHKWISSLTKQTAPLGATTLIKAMTNRCYSETTSFFPKADSDKLSNLYFDFIYFIDFFLPIQTHLAPRGFICSNLSITLIIINIVGLKSCKAGLRFAAFHPP